MIFNDEIDKSELEEWFAKTLDRHNIHRYSQLTRCTETDLLESGMKTGTVRHIYLLLKKKGLHLKDGDNSLCRLGLKYKMLWLLHDSYIDNLTILQTYSKYQLMDECGISYSMANFIEWKMDMLGMPMAKF